MARTGTLVVLAVLLSSFQLFTSAYDFSTLYDFGPPLNPQVQDAVGQWKVLGTSQVHTKGVALTHGVGQKGGFWHPVPATLSSWQVNFKFSVHGSGDEGDHGLAFWYTATPGVSGGVFGNKDKFKGLSVIFDSKDDDGNHNNPSIAAHVYDGTIEYHHGDDGIGDQLAGCVADYRNRPEPITARVTYKRPKKTLEVYLDMAHRGRFQRCLIAENVELPVGYFYGFTGETLEKDDVHMVHSFKVTDLSTNRDGDVSKEPPPPQPMGVDITAPHGDHEEEDHHDADHEEDAKPTSVASKLRSKIAKAKEDHTEDAHEEEAHDDTQAADGSHDQTVQHTQYIASRVDQSLGASHKQTRDHISTHVAAIHEKLDQSMTDQLNALTIELHAVKESLQATTMTALEEKIKALMEKLRKEVDSSLGVYSHHTNEVITTQTAKVDRVSNEVENTRKFIQTQMQGLVHRMEAMSNQVKELEGKVATVGTVRQQSLDVQQLARRLEEVNNALQNKVASHGMGWGATALMVLPLVGLVAVFFQLRSAAPKRGIAAYGNTYKGV